MDTDILFPKLILKGRHPALTNVLARLQPNACRHPIHEELPGGFTPDRIEDSWFRNLAIKILAP